MKDYQQVKEKIMVYIKNKGIQMAVNIPADYRDEIKAIIKGKGEGEISEEAFKYIETGVEVVANAPVEEPVIEEPVIEEPVVKEEFEEGKVEEQPKPKNKKKNKIELS